MSIDDLSYTSYAKPADGPVLAVKDGTAKVTSPYSFNFGLVEAGTTKTFTLSNPGTEAVEGLTVTKTGDFGAKLSATTIAAGDEATLTITMPSTTGSSEITISSTTAGIDDFVINASGTIRDPKKVYLDFAGASSLPDGWTSVQIGSNSSNAWTATDGYVYTNGTSNGFQHALISPKLVFAKDEVIMYRSKRMVEKSSWSTTPYVPLLKVEYSLDGKSWTEISSYTDDAYNVWTQRTATIPVEGVNYIRFNAYNIGLTEIYGGELPVEPKMVVTQPASLDFGVITAAATKTFTIANTGLATLEGINVTSSNSIFAITGAPGSLAAGESAEVTITMDATTTGALSSDITVSANGMDDVQFTVTGIVLPSGMFIVDFNDNTLPTGWGNNASNKWSFSDGKAYCTSAAELTTPKLLFADGDMIAISITSYDDYDNNYLEITGSIDGTTWDAFGTKKYISRSQIPYGSYATLVVTDIPTTVKYLKFKGYYVRIDEIAGLTYDENAPVMAFTAEDFAAGVVTANATKTYSVANSGTGTLTVNIASDNEKFTVEPAQLVITDTPQDFTVTFNYADGVYGKFNANITVTPTYDETAAVTFAASAQVKNPDLWDEDFEGGVIPRGWEANNFNVGTYSGWGTNTNSTNYAYGTSNGATLITPRLQAKANDILTWEANCDYKDEGIKVEYSTDDKATWTVLDIEGMNKSTASGKVDFYLPQDNGFTTGAALQMSFKAPADGYYYLRFTSSYNREGVDNFNGFKLAMKEHDASISALSIRETFNQYIEYTVSVTVKENVGKDETLTAQFFIGDKQYGEDVIETVNALGEKKFTVNVKLNEIISGDAYFKVFNDDINLVSEKVTITTSPAIVLDENVAPVDLPTSGYQSVVALKYTAKKGWNTICLPFGISDDELKSIFGEGFKVYEFKSYSDGVLGFEVATRCYAGYPYIIYSENPVTLDETGLVVTNVQFTNGTKSDSYGGATFQGTYAPIAAPNMEGKYGVVPATGKIQKGSATATMKGFRAYFELPASGARLSFTDVTTGITTVMDASELGDDAFNLKGQRVDTPKKGGLYIIGGKKVIVK